MVASNPLEECFEEHKDHTHTVKVASKEAITVMNSRHDIMVIGMWDDNDDDDDDDKCFSRT